MTEAPYGPGPPRTNSPESWGQTASWRTLLATSCLESRQLERPPDAIRACAFHGQRPENLSGQQARLQAVGEVEGEPHTATFAYVSTARETGENTDLKDRACVPPCGFLPCNKRQIQKKAMTTLGSGGGTGSITSLSWSGWTKDLVHTNVFAC